jgi:inosine-uridine nucleoside N-ribohydrolase
MRRPALLALAAAACASAALPQLALDTDLGTDFDDAWALTYLLARSKPGDADRLFDFKLVQVSTFNTTKRALIAARMMHDVGRYDVPIAVGLYTGEDNMAQFGAVGGYSLAQFAADGGTVLEGTDALADLMRAATPAAPLFVVEIAPATSLGGVVWSDPSLAANTVVIAMSGSVFHGYGNSSAPDAEYNVKENSTASQKMYAAEWLSPLATAPLDTSGLLRCAAPEYDVLLAGANAAAPYAAMLLRNYAVWCGCNPAQQAQTDILYDAQAAYQASFVASRWGGPGAGPPPTPALAYSALRLVVNDSSFTVQDPAGQLVFATVGFPDGLGSDTHAVCAHLVDYIVAQS